MSRCEPSTQENKYLQMQENSSRFNRVFFSSNVQLCCDLSIRSNCWEFLTSDVNIYAICLPLK